MDWKSPFIVYRLSEEGKLTEVFHAEDLKKAKYWLTYIAKNGDILCKTPAHPKHSQATKAPEYWSHKEKSGHPATSLEKWTQFATSKNFDFKFPEEQLSEEVD